MIFLPEFGEVCLFLTICRLDKFEGADLKYGNSLLKNSYPKIPKYFIFRQNLGKFAFSHNL